MKRLNGVLPRRWRIFMPPFESECDLGSIDTFGMPSESHTNGRKRQTSSTGTANVVACGASDGSMRVPVAPPPPPDTRTLCGAEAWVTVDDDDEAHAAATPRSST